METGDGLIVRVRGHAGALTTRQLRGIGDIACHHGNGIVDLTRRANVQIRGVEADDLPSLWSRLADLDLIDAHADAEAVRNVMVDPLAGLIPGEMVDARRIAQALETDLAHRPEFWSLPGKFGFAVDGGGLLSLDGERADIRLRAVRGAERPMMALGVDRKRGTDWLCLVVPALAHEAALCLAAAFIAGSRDSPRARMRDLPDEAMGDLRRALVAYGEPTGDISIPVRRGADRVGRLEAGGATVAVGIGAPFGRLEAPAVEAMAGAAEALGIDAIFLSPWRALFMPATDACAAERLLGLACDNGLITSPVDPLLAIDACPGAPACRSACLDTRATARRIAAMLPLAGVTSVHISGCAKGCARSKPADLVLVDCEAGFGVIRNGTAEAAPGAYIKPDDLDALRGLLKAGS
jgi:precorrin-3B synthase